MTPHPIGKSVAGQFLERCSRGLTTPEEFNPGDRRRLAGRLDKPGPFEGSTNRRHVLPNERFESGVIHAHERAECKGRG